MTTYTDYADDTTGQTLYAKPEPLTTATWGADKVDGTENSTTGSYAFSLNSDMAYVVYRQLGGSAASSDLKLGRFGKNTYLAVSELDDLVRESNVVTEIDSATIKLNIASTKAKTHYVTGNLAGKTLKLYIETAPGTFFAEIIATGADGSFSFTPSSSLVAAVRTFPAALREPSDGNNVLWKGNIEVGYAADAE